MTEPIITIEVSLTRKDVALARLLVYFRSGVGVAVAAVGLGYLIVQRLSPDSVRSIVLPVPLLCLVIVPVAVTCGGLFGRAVTLWLTTLRYTFDESGFAVTAPHVNASLGWADVRAAYQFRRYFVLSTPGALQVIPTATLEGEDTLVLRNIFAGHLGKRAKMRAP